MPEPTTALAVTVRPSTMNDLEAITAIYAHAVTHGTASFELDPPDLDEMSRRRGALVDTGYPYLVAQDGQGEVLGFAYAGPYRSRPAYRWTVEDSIYVAPRARGCGIGRALLSALVEQCEALDFRLMVAVIGDKETAGSIALHRCLGFETAGVLEPIGFKHGRWLAIVLMQRVLGAGASRPPDLGLRA
jgi:phosphinothricin acetyltransferase